MAKIMAKALMYVNNHLIPVLGSNNGNQSSEEKIITSVPSKKM